MDMVLEYETKPRARAKAYQAIKSGKLIRQPCEVCGAIKVDAHHDNYNIPLAVRWLCRKCHLKHHEYHKNQRIRECNVDTHGGYRCYHYVKNKYATIYT